MKILLATDGSEYSEEAARAVACMRLTAEDEVMLVHVVSWVPFRYDAESYYESLKEIKREVAPKIIDAAIEALGPLKARLSTAIIDGSPERYIVDTADEADMDLIVMGARGMKGLKSYFIGSVTKSVALHSAKPVLVIKPGFCGGRAKRRFLFAADGSDFSVAAARFLASLPFDGDSEITIINVIWSDFADIPDRFVTEVNDRVKEMLADTRAEEFRESGKILEQARGLLGQRYRSITTASKIGDPSHEILRAAEEAGADMIIVGCRGLKGMASVMGSVSRNVLSHAPCSVLIGKTCSG
ncbi:MAG: universal stress protein [Nitrospiraceae bacterium]|nr:universal stress protein [Nitrospiraceae bacterium]